MRNELLEIGTYIRERRELLGLLQPQLSAIAGISTRTIQLIENGKANPSLDTLVKLITPLGLDLKLVIKETGDTTRNTA